MELTINLTGTTPIVQHNIRLANPHDEIVQAISRLTGKSAKQKTEQDAFEIERLEWMGGLYYDAAEGYYLESRGVIRCFQEAAKATREGRDVQRALAPQTALTPLRFPQRDLKPAELWEYEDREFPAAHWFDGAHPYRFWKMCGIGKSRVPRMRPIFPEWSLSLSVEFQPDMLDFGALEEIIHRAGKVEGLYEARSLGFGRFQATIVGAVEANGRAKEMRRKAKEAPPVEE
jgi:hypothetical protein